MAYLVGLEAPVGHPRGGSGPVDQSYIGLEIKKEDRSVLATGKVGDRGS